MREELEDEELEEEDDLFLLGLLPGMSLRSGLVCCLVFFLSFSFCFSISSIYRIFYYNYFLYISSARNISSSYCMS